jgi:hypothetical protein
MWSKTGLDGYHSPCYQLPHNKKEGGFSDKSQLRLFYTVGIKMKERTEIQFIDIISRFLKWQQQNMFLALSPMAFWRILLLKVFAVLSQYAKGINLGMSRPVLDQNLYCKL